MHHVTASKRPRMSLISAQFCPSPHECSTRARRAVRTRICASATEIGHVCHSLRVSGRRQRGAAAASARATYARGAAKLDRPIHRHVRERLAVSLAHADAHAMMMIESGQRWTRFQTPSQGPRGLVDPPPLRRADSQTPR